MKPKSTKPKPKFNRRRVYRGWVDGNYSNFSPCMLALYDAFNLRKRRFPSDIPCRITVEWKEKT